MKIFIAAMIFLSTFVGIPTNLGYIWLFGTEILGPLSLIEAGHSMGISRILMNIILILSHIALISLLFLTSKSYFKASLLVVPMVFVIVFTLFNFLMLFLLIPFTIVWVIALVTYNRKHYYSRLQVH